MQFTDLKFGAYEWNDNGNGTFTVKCRSVIDESVKEIVLEDKYKAGFQNWLSGNGNIQDVLPDVSPDVRETLISGLLSEEFDDLFRDDPESQDEFGADDLAS